MGFLLTTIVEVKTRMHRCTIVALDGTSFGVHKANKVDLSLSKMVCVEGRNLPNTYLETDLQMFDCL